MPEGSEEKKGNGSEGSEKGAIDLDKYVPKEDHEKLTASHKTEVEKLQGELDKAKLSLLDPDYIEFQEKKKGKGKPDDTPPVEDKNLDDMSSRELADHIANSLKESVVKPLQDELNKTKHTLNDVLAVIELQEVEKRYPDFGDYRDDVRKLIESSTTALTFEQAYKIAKTNRAAADDKDKDKPKGDGPPGSEKPTGSVPNEELDQKDYDTPEAAADAAWNKAVGPGKATL